MQPVYETRRLRLMPAGPELAGAAVDYYRRNRTFLAAFEPAREESFFTQEGQRSLLTEEARLAEEDRSYRFYLALREAPERIVGLVGLNNLVRGAFQSCFLGYKLDGGLLRRGYMTEAVEEAVRIAFTVLGLHRIEANIMPRNTASLGVARKAGFQEEGLAVRYLRINGVWEDHIHMVRRDE
ncbi:30S ribosomal protein S5 alanine N-acetyltransferase [Oscillospiraceae bacterium]|uniref:GNAT family N-acetyltransferase n=1 Tax=Intestinimonas sp. TaxID=1965293 RepID=UPI00308C4FC2|nr:30S ribosomal protein S5 alanine N-acetyltransferase [Oscillospiraceae bacterium]